MESEPITPVAVKRAAPPKPLGRRADLWAAMLASLGAILAVTAAIWFFLGFAENDQRPEHLLSALILTGGLFAFAVAPFAITANLAQLSYRLGGRRRYSGWAVFLMLPWVVLSGLAMVYTPLPGWVTWSATLLSTLLLLWAIVSLLLDWSPDRPISDK